jgi:Cu-Zn family superoxide dismutase
MRFFPKAAGLSAAAIAVLLAQAGTAQETRPGGNAPHAAETRAPEAHGTMWASVTKAVAVLHGTGGHEGVSGTITFSQSGGKVMVMGTVSGLVPNQKHAIHVHEFGDCSSPDGAAAGSHYNPEGNPHAMPPEGHRHAGDMGNLVADKDGKAVLELTLDNITVAGVRNPVLGRAVIVHEKPDDGGQPVGNAGARIACGVIGIAK